MTVGAVDREQRVFEAVPSSARAARRFVSDALRTGGAPPAVVGDFELVVSELAANLIEHGDGSGLMVCVDVADERWWDVEVAGGAEAADDFAQSVATWTVAGPDQPSGRGLGIVRQLMDDVTAGYCDGVASVRCRRHRPHR